jgi:prolipoprotein diacylglyceryltransferase
MIFAVALGAVVYRWRLQSNLEKTFQAADGRYFIWLSLGSLVGAHVLGTLNLSLHGELTFGRSILGALFGAIITVEVYKLTKGMRSSTGYIYVVPICVAIIIGRIGCFYSGIEDNTHGVITDVAWAWDFGDGITRHPVQLYESLSMTLFLFSVLLLLKLAPQYFIKYGFYLFIGFYCSQRFLWEFLKPYPTVIGLNVFQWVCIALVLYSLIMIRNSHDGHSRA